MKQLPPRSGEGAQYKSCGFYHLEESFILFRGWINIASFLSRFSLLVHTLVFGREQAG